RHGPHRPLRRRRDVRAHGRRAGGGGRLIARPGRYFLRYFLFLRSLRPADRRAPDGFDGAAAAGGADALAASALAGSPRSSSPISSSSSSPTSFAGAAPPRGLSA